MDLPEITQQPIIHIDATPDEDYPLRILRAYRQNNNCKWVSTGEPDALLDMMNEHCDQRAALLDEAIAILVAASGIVSEQAWLDQVVAGGFIPRQRGP